MAAVYKFYYSISSNRIVLNIFPKYICNYVGLTFIAVIKQFQLTIGTKYVKLALTYTALF
jgi:hypothetical protein